MAGQLTHRWNQATWRGVARVLTADLPTNPRKPPKRGRRQRQLRLVPEVMDNVMADYQSGLSAVAVGLKYGISAETVFNNLHARGIPVRARSQPTISGTALQEAIALRAAGWTYTEIGKHYGVSRTTVSNVLNNHRRQHQT